MVVLCVLEAILQTFDNATKNSNHKDPFNKIHNAEGQSDGV